MHTSIEDEANSLYPSVPSSTEAAEEELIRRAVVRLNGTVLGFVIGSVCAVALFIATNWLVLKGGEVVGPHLRLLDQFFWGYSVTFFGSFVGALYAFLVGFASGLFIAWVYNGVLRFRSN